MNKIRNKSVIVKKFGDLETIEIGDISINDTFQDDHLQVKVDYGGLNFADIYTRKGLLPGKTVPFVLGIECTGVIVKVGKKHNSNFEVGQKVICYDYNGGLYREYINISPKKCFLLPDWLDSKEGCAIFVNYLTAYFSVIRIGNLKEYESILILSCTGGVGCASVQLSKTIKGVKIFGTGSKSKKKYAEEDMGIHRFFCINNFQNDVSSYKFDVIISNEGGTTFHFLQRLLKPLGRIILIGANNMLGKTLNNEVTNDSVRLESLLINNQIVAGLHLGILLEMEPELIKNTLEYIFKLIQEKKLRLVIHSIYKMSEIIEATKLLEERKNFGKVLIKINE